MEFSITAVAKLQEPSKFPIYFKINYSTYIWTAEVLTIQDIVTHAGHDPHVARHVSRVSDLNANLGQGRSKDAHAEWNDVHGPPWKAV